MSVASATLEAYRPRRSTIATPSLARSTATMSASTAVSRVTGFARTWAIAYALGVTALSGSYTLANNVPNMVYELVAGGVLSSVFIPLLIERKQREGDADAWRYASTVFNISMIALGLFAIGGTVWAEGFIRTQTFRISAADAALATYLFRFFAVQIVFYGASAIFTGVLNSYRSFLAPAVAPIFNNIVVIITLLGFYVPFRNSSPDLALAGLAIGTTLGVVSLAVVQVPALIRLGVRYTPRIDWRHPALAKTARKMGPVLIYVVTNLVAISFRNAYSTAVTTEGPAVLAYAWNFYQLPYGIFAVALATAIFPELAHLAEEKDWAGFKSQFARGLKATGTIIIPMAVMLVVLAEPLIGLYRVGRFEASDIPAVSSVLVWWAAGLIFFASYMFVLKTFYSLQDTRTPMLTNLGLAVVHIGGYAVLTTGAYGWPGLGLAGIPIADGIFFVTHLAVLGLLLRRRIGGFDIRGITWGLTRVLFAAAVGGLIASQTFVLTSSLGTAWVVLLARLAVAGSVGLAVTYALAAVIGVPEVTWLWQHIRSRLDRGTKP
jgi:putative peptidoglycan lipid II flippase